MRLRRLAILLAVSIGVGLGSNAAFGYWTGFDTALHGTGASGAATISQGSSPTADSHGSYVVVDWGASSLNSGQAIDGYIVQRYDAVTDEPQTMLSGCTGTITATTCTELGLPEGRWKYTVTPVLADNWRGTESTHSGTEETGPSVLLLDRTVFGPPLPTQLTGDLTGFVGGEGISYELDGVPISGSPSVADAGGTAQISVTIPAGTADGSHTITLIGDDPVAPSHIDGSFLIDTTAPTMVPFTTPAPNAAGWHNTSPVEVNATVDDGAGSGIAYAKYTDDGSDPRTSPTSKFATAPLSITESTTFRYFVADLAGNESPVELLEVKIDTTPPMFTDIEFIDVTGSVYLTLTSPEGVPGKAWYGGAEAGSFRFKVTPLPLGGSPVISAGFADIELGPGFTFDGATVTSPVGGPFVSSVESWVAGTTSTPQGALVLTDAAGNTFGSSGFFFNDSTAPTGGSVDAAGLTGTGARYSTSTTLNLNLAKGADGAGAGLADGTGQSDKPSKLMRASAPLTSAGGTADGTCGTYSAYAQVGGDDPAAAVSDTVPADATCYRYRYLVPDHLSNFATYESPDIKVQSAPAASLRPTDATITPVSGTAAQSVSDKTVFYNPGLSGSFYVDSSASAPFSGISNLTFPGIPGFTGGGVQTTPNSGTTYRTTYSWSANAASPSPGVQPISATNNTGLTSTNTTAFSVIKDGVAPSGGSVDATGLGGTGGRYSTSTTLNLAFTPGSDSGAGLASDGRRLMRASALLTSNGTSDGLCGAFGEYSQVGTDPASPATDVVPVDRNCYRYQYVVSDKVGNEATFTSPEIKVAAAVPPAPTLSFSNLSSAYWSGSGNAVFYSPAAASGGFRVTASSADTTSGTTGYGFPTLPSGWSGNSGGTGIHNYSWSSANPTAPSGSQTVTATNNAGRQWTTSFTATPDSAGPSSGSVTYTNGYSTASTVSVTFNKGTDSGSGLAATGGLLQRSSATLSGGLCGTFGAFATVATSPTSPNSNSVTTGNCYQYRYLSPDNVGNQSTFTSGSIVKVDSTGPTNALSLTSSAASLTGSTVYYKGNAAGSLTFTNAVADAASGPASTTYPLIGTTGWVHNAETVSTPTGGPYTSLPFSWTATPTNPTTKTVTGRDGAGRTTNITVTFISDTTAPAGGSLSYGDGLYRAASVPVTAVTGTDAQSGLAASGPVLQRSVATLDTATQACGAFGAFSPVTLSGGNDTSVTSGNCYQYRYVVTDKVGNQTTYTSASVARVDTSTYSQAVAATSGLINYYRLGESTSSATISTDTMTGTAGTTLAARSGETGATWSQQGTVQTDAVLTDAGRLRRNGVGTAVYTASGTPSTPDYEVQMDGTIRSVMNQDAVQVIGRAGSGDNYYTGGYISNGAGNGRAEITKVVNGVTTVLATTPAPLAAGQTYTLKLRMVGNTISLWNGASQVLSVTDGTFTAAGKAGLRLGFAGATPAPTNTTGVHVDNYSAAAFSAAAIDSKSANNGSYVGGPTVGVTGAIAGDSNTAASFDGVDDYVTAARQIADDFSIEFWFKSTQGLNLGTQWYDGAGMVDAEVNAGVSNDFGVTLRADGKVLAGIGAPDVTIVSTNGGYNNGAWHHVVFTRTRLAGTLALYIDGVPAGTASGVNTASLTGSATIGIGQLATNANRFAGSLDEIALYGSALPASVVASHYARR